MDITHILNKYKSPILIGTFGAAGALLGAAFDKKTGDLNYETLEYNPKTRTIEETHTIPDEDFLDESEPVEDPEPIVDDEDEDDE